MRLQQMLPLLLAVAVPLLLTAFYMTLTRPSSVNATQVRISTLEQSVSLLPTIKDKLSPFMRNSNALVFGGRHAARWKDLFGMETTRMWFLEEDRILLDQLQQSCCADSALPIIYTQIAGSLTEEISNADQQKLRMPVPTKVAQETWTLVIVSIHHVQAVYLAGFVASQRATIIVMGCNQLMADQLLKGVLKTARQKLILQQGDRTSVCIFEAGGAENGHRESPPVNQQPEGPQAIQQVIQQPVAATQANSPLNAHLVQQPSSKSKRAIFCATAGHTGTELLSRMFGVFPDTIAEHTPEPRMLLTQFNGALPETRADREALKLGSIVKRMEMAPSMRVYAETSDMFVKTFWDLDWQSQFGSVTVIILRRTAAAVVKEHLTQGLAADMSDTTMLKDAAIAWPQDIAHVSPKEKLAYYVLDIEQRVQRLRQQLAGKATFVEVWYEDLLTADAQYLRSLFTQLGYTVSEEQVAALQASVGEEGQPRSSGSSTISYGQCLDALWNFVIQHQPRMEPAGLLALMHHRRPGVQTNVMAVAEVWQASDSIDAWLDHVLQFVDGVVLVDNKSTDRTVSIAQAHAGRVTVLPSQEWAADTRAALTRGLQEALRQGATQVVRLDTDQLLTRNIAAVARALLTSLPPGAAAQLALWYVWDGVGALVASAQQWDAARNGSVAYSPAADSTGEWDGAGQLPAGVSDAPMVSVGGSAGGILDMRYADIEAYRVKVQWSKVLAWREAKEEGAAGLKQLHAGGLPEHVTTTPIPQEWTVNLEPWRRQQVLRATRAEQLAAWRADLDAAALYRLLGEGSPPHQPGEPPVQPAQQQPMAPALPVLPSQTLPSAALPPQQPAPAPPQQAPATAQPSAAGAQRGGSPGAGTVRFLVLVGVEGSGHHLAASVLSPETAALEQQATFGQTLARLQAALWNHKDPKSGLFNMHCAASNGADLFGKVVALLKQAAAEAAAAAPGGVVVPLNAHEQGSAGMLSYPNLAGPCRALQYPDLDALYRACDEARVECSHLLMLRNPYSAVASTIRRGLEASAAKQIKTQSMMQAVIFSQMQANLDRRHWCWQYGAAAATPALGQAMGWRDATAFLQHFGSAFSGPTAGADERANQLKDKTPPWLRQQLEGTFELLGTLCK